MKKGLFLILALFVFHFLFASEDGYNFDDFMSEFVSRSYTKDEGLPANSASDIIQDSTGYVYIGTYEGMVRFDGVDFTIFNRGLAEKYNFVAARRIFQASDGAIWVGSNDEGIFRLVMDSEEAVRSFSKAEGLPNNSVRAISEDKSGNIWVATASGVAYITKDFKIVNPDPSFQSSHQDLHNLVTSLFTDKNGRVWVTTDVAGGIYYFENTHFQSYSFSSPVLQNRVVSSINQTNAGQMIFGVAPNLAVMGEGSGAQVFNLGVKSGRGTVINDIEEDKNGAIWFATDAGISILKNGKMAQYTEAEGLMDNSINRILEDREGNIWFATDHAGVQKINRGIFRMYTTPSSVNAIAEGKDNRVWLALDKGVACYRMGETGFVPEENAITEFCKGARVRHIGITQNGDILVSTYAHLGQLRFSPNGTLVGQWKKSDGLTGEKVRVAIESSKTHDLYVGTTTGLNVINSETGEITTYTTDNGLAHNYIMAIYEDPASGKIYLGTDGGGVVVMSNGHFTEHYTSDNGLSGNIVFKISKDSEGALCVCTGSGISKLQNGKFVNYTKSSGLGTDSIFQMLEDTHGNTWLTSNAGIASLSQKSMAEFANGTVTALTPKYYSRFDGLKTRGASSTSLSMCDSNGLLWFTLIDGFAVCDPSKIKPNTIKPTVHIEKISIDDHTYYANNNTLVIPAGARRVVIKFAGLSFVSSELLRFKFKLDGFDSDFSDWQSMRTASYTNLKPGKYTFRLIAENNDKVLSDEDTSVHFFQKAFFYQKPIFWIALAAAIALIFVQLTLTILSIINQLNLLKNAVAELSSGNADLTKRVSMKKRSVFRVFDELVAEENKFLEKFQSIIAKVKDSEKMLGSVGHDMGLSTENATSAISSIIHHIDKVRTSIEAQNERVEETADAVNHIAGNISQLEKMIDHTAQGVSSASGAVEEMVGNIQDVNSAIDNMAALFEQLETQAQSGQSKEKAVSEKILQIEEKSKMLQEANTAIASIASQTNLLAMNAAIEAAHAGEAGRGFAVVSEEIRKLSETSSKQSKTIGIQLKGIQSSILDVVSASQESSSAFTAVSDEIVRTNQLVQQIKGSMDEQTEGSKQVMGSLKQMKESSSDVAKAAREMNEGSQTILENVSELKETSGEMNQSMVQMFQGAHRVSESGVDLSGMSIRMKDAIADISDQMVQFTV